MPWEKIVFSFNDLREKRSFFSTEKRTKNKKKWGPPLCSAVKIMDTKVSRQLESHPTYLELLLFIKKKLNF